MTCEVPIDTTQRSILSHISALTLDLQDRRQEMTHRESLLALLSDAEDLLTRRPTETTRIREIAFGLFRLVTDSWELERTPVGQRLMALSGELRDYVAAFGNEQM